MESLVIQLRDVATGAILGTLSRTQRDFLVAELEEESTTDQDYYFDADTIAMLEDADADAELLGVLRTALAGRESMDVAWSEM